MYIEKLERQGEILLGENIELKNELIRWRDHIKFV
jgi:hypothetical protein